MWINQNRILKLAAGSLAVLAVSMLLVAFFPEQRVEWGEQAEVGQGTMRTFVERSWWGKPGRVGVYFTQEAITGLPEEPFETRLNFADTGRGLPFDHFALNWSPEGHEPPGVYTTPHFDLHFYLISVEQREEILAGVCTSEEDSRIPDPPGEVPVTCEVFAKGMQPLPSEMMPPDYSIGPFVLPWMGNHLADITAPEHHGESFTHTMIYGAYEGSLNFLEPMVAITYLEQQEDACEEIKTPQVMPEEGWYPTRYCVEYLEQKGAYTYSLEAFEWFDAWEDDEN